MQFQYAEAKVEIVKLAKSFPALKNAPLKEWDPELLDNWGVTARRVLWTEDKPVSQAIGRVSAVEFVLGVWDSTEQWRVGYFDAIRAMRYWSDEDKNAFRAWCADPWSR